MNTMHRILAWTLAGIVGLLCLAGNHRVAAQEATPIPSGVVKDFTFAGSTIFPGTTSLGKVFIPAQYDGTQPACVYVRQDGYEPKEKPLLEAMIAAREMPVTVGVFVRPGTVPPPRHDTLGRRNRGFEYDGLGDNYARFLTEELLPFVAKTFDLKLSASGNNRCIAGASSGGIAAFNAAWERPDAFSRVYCNSGSFVAFRGGNAFPTMVRKFEAKPIRAYLTAATHDMENAAGDWFLLNQEMDKALKFSGYDYQFHAVEGGHVAGWIDHFRAAMNFIWKDWPNPVEAGPSAPRVRDIIMDGHGWEPVARGYDDPRSLACNSKGEVFFVDTAVNKVYRVGLDGAASVFLDDARQADGLAVGLENKLYTVSVQTGNVLCYDDGAQEGHVYASGVNGQHVFAMPTGGLYVSGPGENPKTGSLVWFVKDGNKTLVDAFAGTAAGLACRPDQWLLAVADGASKWVYSFQIKGDGMLMDKEWYYSLLATPDDDDAGTGSICYAREGQILAATSAGVQVCADDGPTQAVLPLPDRSRVVSVCLGGPEMNTLFACGGGVVWKRVVKIHAAGAFLPWTGVKGSPL